MYTIYVDGNALYSPLLTNEGYCVLNPKITMELNKAGSLSFLLPPNNVMYDSIKKLKSIVTVYEGETEIFRGRVLHDEKDFYNRKNVYCEGELAFLLDSPIRPYTFKGDIPDLFKKFINAHNSAVESEKQFEIGDVTVVDSNNYINRSNTDYSNTWQEINDKLIKLSGGYLRSRINNGTRYIDYIADYNHINNQVIQFGENMLDISEYITAENVFTCLIPVGADGLTIKSVNNNRDYIQDDSAVALFGKIWKTHKWDDVTVPSNLLNKAKTYLNEGIEMAVSLTISAVDLHLINIDTESIKLGDKIRVLSLPHKIDKYFLCSKIVLDLVKPDNTSYTLGVNFSTMTDKQTEVQETVSIAASAAVSAQVSASQASSSASEATSAVSQIIVELPTEYVKTVTFTKYQESVTDTLLDIEEKINKLPITTNYAVPASTITSGGIIINIEVPEDGVYLVNCFLLYSVEDGFGWIGIKNEYTLDINNKDYYRIKNNSFGSKIMTLTAGQIVEMYNLNGTSKVVYGSTYISLIKIA